MSIKSLDSEKYDEYQKLTIQTYDRNADKWSSAHEKVLEWQNALDKFKKDYLSSGAIVDVGCGSGRDISYMSELGYDCTGIDASERLLEVAKTKSSKVKFINKNLFELSELELTFDGFLCIATLLHIPKVKLGEALENIKSILKPEAKGLIIIKKGTGEEFEIRDVDGRHEERLFSYWEPEEFSKELKKVGFSTQETFQVKVGRSVWIGIYVSN